MPSRPTDGAPRTRGDGRVGVIVPMSNLNLEPDLGLLLPPGVSAHVTRAGGYDLDAVPDSEQMRAYADAALEPVAALLAPARPDVVLYGCTSATLAHGPQYDRAFAARLARLTGAPAITAAGALVLALRDLGTHRVAFASPYTEALNREAARFLEAAGVEVVRNVYVGEDLGNYGQGELEPDEVLSLGLRADCETAEAIVLSCTDMRAVEIIERLEARTGKPVVTSNQAMVHAALGHLAIEGTVPGRLGRITALAA